MEEPDPSTLSRLTNGQIAGGIAAVLILGIFILFPTIRHHMNHVITDDAYVSGNLVTVASMVSARIERMPAGTGDTVQAGDPLVILNDGPFQAALTKSRAAASSARSKLAETEIILEREKHRAGPVADQYEAEWTATKAHVNAALADREHALSNLKRAELLLQSGLIAESELEATRMTAQRRKAELEEARERVNKAAAGVRMEDNLHPVRIQHQKVATARAELALAEAEVDRAEIEARETRAISPVRGIVAKTTVNTGELVDEGQTLAFVHDLDTLWVVANIEETQIAQVKIGQPVQITIDAWPDSVLQGIVRKIGSVTGSQFAIIPRESLGGNFVKTVQRVPVRISVQDPGQMLQLGLSAIVAIDIR
jgi:membrane fusion protein, multidrug efflux system